MAVVGKKRQEPVKDEGGFPWGVVLGIFIVIRIILRIVRNNS
jgi:hypothetical protein